MTNEEPVRQRKRPMYFMVIAAGLAIAAAFAIAEVVKDRSDVSNDDSSPAPRTPANAPFIVTNDLVVDKMVELAQLSPGDLVYDLGCGDGRIVITAATTTGCRGLGLEIDPEIVAKARQNAKEYGVEELVTIKQQDVFEADLSEADCVVMYLLPWMIKKLIPQFEKLRPGTRIVSHNYGFGGDLDYIEPDERYEVDVPGDSVHRVYVWVTPLKVPSENKAK